MMKKTILLILIASLALTSNGQVTRFLTTPDTLTILNSKWKAYKDSLFFAQGLALKQANLVSGTNIKTINGISVLGSGNISITSGTITDTSFLSLRINDRVKYTDTSGMLAAYARAANFFNKTQSDARYLQSYTETDPVWTAAQPNYRTFAQNNILYAPFTHLHNLAGLTDVNTASVFNNAVLKYNISSGKWEPATDQTGSAGGGITSINGDNNSVQSFTVLRTGTGFKIVTSGGVHTFYNPITSATDTGAVTPALYNAWNAKQPGNTNLTTIAALAPSNNDFLQWKAGVWTNRTVLQVKADLGYSTVAASGDYNDLLNRPTIPAAPVNADWNANSGLAQILNRPNLGSAALLNVPSSGNASSTEVVKGNDSRLNDSRAPTAHNHVEADVIGLTAALAAKQALLNGTGFVKSTSGTISYDNNSYTVANGAITPGTNTKITYDAKGLVTGGAAATTSDIPEGSNLYFTDARVRSVLLTGFSTSTSSAVTAADNFLVAAGKFQAQINNNISDISGRLPLAGGTMSGNITLGENTSVSLDPAGSADGKYSGITTTGTGGAAIAFGDLLMLDVSTSRWKLVDISVSAGAAGDARNLLGMAVTSSTNGTAVTVLLQGIIRADSNFPTLTVGAAVYASSTGDITVTQPSATDYIIRIIGFALTADEIFFNPSNDWITHN